ncbi:hypothetical protein DFH09DRAFT_1195320 [Mycena vulgaris]|nr:hypothetical protein DFH09DRAFT_1195320 [Mycena vulgaris]
MNPLTVQELVDHCIGFLYNSVPDLRACALVSRAWVDAAQSNIFRRISIMHFGNVPHPSIWMRLKETLNTSPHLIRHIQQLTVVPDEISLADFSALCNLPFTHLDRVFVFNYPHLSASTAGFIQKLLSLPTVRRVGILCTFDHPTRFLQIWDRCSPSIRHLELYITEGSTPIVRPAAHHCSAPIVLESLRITSVEGLGGWLAHELCPFDFSTLKLLSVHTNTNLLCWPIFRSALSTIEALDFKAYDGWTPCIDLSPFTNLVTLRMSMAGDAALAVVLDTLSTVTPVNSIQTIIVTASRLDAAICAQLESKIISLPLHRSVLEVEMNLIIGDVHRNDNLAKYFPTLSAMNKLRQIDRDGWTDNWFDTVAGDEGSVHSTLFA